MQAYEIFRRLSSDELDDFVIHACEDDEIPDKIAGGVLTYHRIPLKRFSKLPESTRKAYVRRTLRDRQAADLSLFVISAALTRNSADLISTFLDGVGLPHTGPSLSIEGEIPEPATEVLEKAVDELVSKFPERAAAIYLRAFASQPDVHWKVLDARLESDARLALEDRSAAA